MLVVVSVATLPVAWGGAIPSGAALATSDQTASCSNVFSGEQGALTLEAPRYVASMAIVDNGDGTFRVPYHLVLWRTLGHTYTADRAYDCVFVDGNGNSQPEPDESLFGVVVDSPVFSQATSSSVRYELSVTAAAEPGSRICARGQVDSSYMETRQDRSQFFCETLPAGEVQMPVGTMGGLGISAALSAVGALLLRRRRGDCHPSRVAPARGAF